MNGELMLYLDQYGSRFFAATVAELREAVGGGLATFTPSPAIVRLACQPALIGENKMKRLAIVATVLALTVSAVVAQVDIIKSRQQIMKGVGKATGELAKVMKGEAAFNLNQAQDAFKIYADAGKKMPDLFPDTSKTGADTGALPKIWETKADFDAKFAKLTADAEALGPTITDEASFKAAFMAVTKNCGGCHENYRAKVN